MGTLIKQVERPLLFVRFPPAWAHIEPLREYACLCAGAHGHSGSAGKVGLVVNELLENAVKYGSPTGEILLEMSEPSDHTLEIRVTNKAHPSRVAVLEREFKRVSGDSARGAFIRALERLQKLPQGSTMLGLSRMATEAKLDLQISGDQVVVTATIGGVAMPVSAGARNPSSQNLREVRVANDGSVPVLRATRRDE